MKNTSRTNVINTKYLPQQQPQSQHGKRNTFCFTTFLDQYMNCCMSASGVATYENDTVLSNSDDTSCFGYSFTDRMMKQKHVQVPPSAPTTISSSSNSANVHHRNSKTKSTLFTMNF